MRPLIVPLSRTSSPVQALPAILMPAAGSASVTPPSNGVTLALSYAYLNVGGEAVARVTVIDGFGDPVPGASIDDVTIIGLGVAVIVGSVPAATNASGWAEWRVRAQAEGTATMTAIVDGQPSNTVPIVVRALPVESQPTGSLLRMPYRKLGR